MAGLRDWKSNNVRAYFLQHPDASIKDAAKALGVSERTAAQVRSELAEKGLVTPGRNRVVRPPKQPVILPEPPAPGHVAPEEPTPTTGLLDDQTMRRLADPNTSLQDLDLDDDETRKILLREVKKLAFSPLTSPDTRLSATQVWLKLKDMAKSRELGPGKPLTHATALSRLVALLRAVGAEFALAAMYEAFNVKEAPDAPAQDEQTAPPVGTTTATLPPGHEGTPQEAKDLRTQ